MENQITSNENAMRLFFTEDIFLVKDPDVLTNPDLGRKPVATVAEIATVQVQQADLTPGIALKHNEIPVPEVYIKPVEKLPILEEPVPVKTFKFLGGNQKSVLILVHDEQNEVSTEQGRTLLRNIVKAINLSTPDFALINYAHNKGTDFTELHQFFKPTLMLVFGLAPTDLKMDLIWANEIVLHQNTRMIFAPNLHQLDGDLTAKKMLWANIKSLTPNL